jgi:pyrroline-5-carboxylate reductase
MAALGHAEWFADEAAFQLGGVLTGAGPAFLFRFIEALGKGAAALGLAEDQALRLATAMVAGAGVLAATSEHPAAELARKVASPNGTTEAGLKVLDADRALLALVEATLGAARARSLEMAAEARARD